MPTKRLGIIGFGYIGQAIYERTLADPDFEIAFVWNRSPGRLAGVPESLILDDLNDFASRRPDLVIEMAHPSLTAVHGEAFLGVCDYMALSVTALADEGLYQNLLSVCAERGTTLFIPHGALIGVDNLVEARDNWSEVGVTFFKHPNSLDLSALHIDPATLTTATTVFDGSVREAARLFPRNVNTMATCALATLGFDRTHARVVADPALSSMIAEVHASGKNGSRFKTVKEEPAVGVSGAGMLVSQWASIKKAVRGGAPGLNFV